MKKLARLTWDRLSIYLPVMLMGLLALGTYWLVRITPTTSAPEPEQQVRHEPDYFMRTFSVKTFNEKGQLQSEVNGIEGRHFPTPTRWRLTRCVCARSTRTARSLWPPPTAP